METRVVKQVKVYYAMMNPMTGKAEGRFIAATGFSKEEVITLFSLRK